MVCFGSLVALREARQSQALPSELDTCGFPSLCCGAIFTLEEPNQSLFSCRQQLPWQHPGRSPLKDRITPQKRPIRTFCTYFAPSRKHLQSTTTCRYSLPPLPARTDRKLKLNSKGVSSQLYSNFRCSNSPQTLVLLWASKEFINTSSATDILGC